MAVDRLYERYLTDHAGDENPESVRVVLQRDLTPWIPSKASDCLDLGCGQGGLVAFLRSNGFTGAVGVDISPEQVARAHELGRTYIKLGDVSNVLHGAQKWDVITAFDFLEHLERDRVLPIFEDIRGALAAHGRFIARVPNAAGPFSGAIQFGDFTHKSQFTAQSLSQLAKAAGFGSIQFREVRPVVHSAKSLGRRVAWSAFAGATKLGMAAETGRVRGHLVTSNIMAYLSD